MDMHFDGKAVTVRMTRKQFSRLSDVVRMADFDFESLDAEVSAGGDMTSDDMSELANAWYDMTTAAEWPQSGVDSSATGR